MRDFLPADVRKRNYVIGIIKEVYESYGFEPLETPAIENLETLTGKYGEEGGQLMFKILKRGEKLDLLNLYQEAKKQADWTVQELDAVLAQLRPNSLADLALRYDLTVPLARVVANNRNELPKFFKRYQIQPVWRADRPARGRFREFYQCDVDSIGSSSMAVEAELISAVSEILNRLGFKDFVIRINHRKLLSGILGYCVSDESKHLAAITAIDKLDKIGSEGVIKELDLIGIDEQESERLIGIFENYRDQISAMTRDPFIYRTLLEMLDQVIGGDSDVGKAGIADLMNLGDLICELGDKFHWQIDPSLARGLSYYTGAIMEISVPDLAGSLGGGGRYDGLIGMFGKEQIPACGFSLGLERILVVMEERGMFPPEIAESTPANVMVTIWSDETVGESLKLANELRAEGLRVTVYPQADKEDKQWKYANAIRVPWICTVNDQDIEEGMVSFQNLRTRDRYREPIDKAAAKIKQSA